MCERKRDGRGIHSSHTRKLSWLVSWWENESVIPSNVLFTLISGVICMVRKRSPYFVAAGTVTNMAVPTCCTSVSGENGRWWRKDWVLYLLYLLYLYICFSQAWSLFNAGNWFWSNWYDHFTSSWPVCWLDGGVIIIKRGEEESLDSLFSVHHCALHILTCFSLCNSRRKSSQAEETGFVYDVILHTVTCAT